MKLYNNRTDELKLSNLYIIQQKIDGLINYQNFKQPNYYILNNTISSYTDNAWTVVPMFTLQELVDADLLWPALINGDYCWIFHLSRLKLHCGLLNNWVDSCIWLGSQSTWLYKGHNIRTATAEEQTYFQKFNSELQISNIFVSTTEDTNNSIIGDVSGTTYELNELQLFDVDDSTTSTIDFKINSDNNIQTLLDTEQLYSCEQGETLISECQDESENQHEDNANRLLISNYHRYNFTSSTYLFTPVRVQDEQWSFEAISSEAVMFDFTLYSLPTRYYYQYDKYLWPADTDSISASFATDQLKFQTGNAYLNTKNQLVFSQFITNIGGSEEEVLVDDSVSFNRSILEKKQQVYYTINIKHNDFPFDGFLVAYVW